MIVVIIEHHYSDSDHSPLFRLTRFLAVFPFVYAVYIPIAYLLSLQQRHLLLSCLNISCSSRKIVLPLSQSFARSVFACHWFNRVTTRIIANESFNLEANRCPLLRFPQFWSQLNHPFLSKVPVKHFWRYTHTHIYIYAFLIRRIF